MVQRKLSAILAADVVGYAGLMESDEAGTLELLKTNRAQIFDPKVAAHGGRIFKLVGDGALVEFASAIDAVNCAIDIQSAMAGAEADAPDRLTYRIGVNLGDVIVEGDDIYGEGVNVAARLQTLAPEGGIALSRSISDQVSGKVAAQFEDLGLHTLKNIERPVHVFAARPAISPPKPKARTGNRVSICVLPFANMSGDLEQEYFSDGITEDIITDLSKVSALLVTARNTAFTFKGKHVDISELARRLRVGHVLEGSVRKSGNRVRITAQLIDGATGAHTWAERYDRDLSDIFTLQDQLSQAIVAALKLRLLPEEKSAIERRGTSDPEAYQLFLLARQYSISGNYGAARRTEAIIRLCRRATEIDANYAQAWGLMAVAQANRRFFTGAGENGWAAAEQAIALDASIAEPYAAKARLLVYDGHGPEALGEIETALRLDPQSYEVNLAAGFCYFALRKYAEAIEHLEKATALVEGEFRAAGMLNAAYIALGDQDGARGAAQRSVERAEKILAAEPDNGSAMGFLVGGLAILGEVARAKAWIERAMLLDPDNFSMRFNIACAFATTLGDPDGALDLLGPYLAHVTAERLAWAKVDASLDLLRTDPRFRAMMEAAEERLKQAVNSA